MAGLAELGETWDSPRMQLPCATSDSGAPVLSPESRPGLAAHPVHLSIWPPARAELRPTGDTGQEPAHASAAKRVRASAMGNGHELERIQAAMLDDDPLAKGKTPGDAPEGSGDSPRPDRGPKRDPIGEVFGDRYEVREEIGSGAFAVTYHGWDLRLDRAVAIKVLRDTYASDPTPVQRFEREARAAASVSQGNVVDVYDFGRQDDQLYIVMQYVKGEDLKHLIIREGPLPRRRAANIALQILAGLAAIHEAGIIHRDIKPQNVLIGPDDIARVTDFGIAHVTVEAGLTTAGTTFGTATYMAPEQAEAGPLVQATDLYSVGIVLYEMLTARLPFEAPTMIALILAHLHTIPSPPSIRAPAQHITPELDAVVLRALEKHPDDRFRDAPAMARAVSAAVARLPFGTEPAHVISTGDERTVRTTPPRTRRATGTWPQSADRPARSGRRVMPIVLLLLLLAAAAGGGAYLSSLDDGGDPPDDDPRQIVADLAVSPTPTERSTEVPVQTPVPTDVPTDTPVPTATPTETPQPTIAPTDTPEPTLAPTAAPPPTETPTEPPTPTPTDAPEPLPTESPPLIVPRDSDVENDEGSTVGSDQAGEDGNGGLSDADGQGTVTLSFTASDWQGAYFQETGNMRPWSGVYAQSTGYGSGSLSFSLDGTPASDMFSLTVDGMTSENWSEVPMSLLINGQEVYEGTSPFPTWNGIEGEQPWATVNVELPTSVLQQGENTVTFVNLVGQGDFSRPPYILLAGGTLTIELGSGG